MTAAGPFVQLQERVGSTGPDERMHEVHYRTLGRSGCSVSSLALGTMTFGRETEESGSVEQLDRFTAAGGTLVDTADVYAGTESEFMA